VGECDFLAVVEGRDEVQAGDQVVETVGGGVRRQWGSQEPFHGRFGN